MTVEPSSATWQLWGKADPARAGDGPSWHPLLCHVLDVVACADRLLSLRSQRLATLVRSMGMTEEEGRPWLLLFVGLHDLGKATPPFQAQVEERRSALTALGYDFADDHWSAHGELTCPLASSELAALGMARPFARQVARAVGGHHGIIPSVERVHSLTSGEGLVSREGGKALLWRTAAAEVTRAVRQILAIEDGTSRPPQRPVEYGERHGLLADLAGLTTTADWLGSNADVFRYAAPPSEILAYWRVAQERAVDAVDRMGWRAPPRPTRRTFSELFGKSPWPLHTATEEQLGRLIDGPTLIVIEAPMGEGKTEAALSVFDALASAGASGLYFALPTQATANQILGRVRRYLDQSFPGETHGLHLIHGDAGMSDTYDALKTEAFARLRSVDGPAQGRSGTVADAWFAASKRALLAPIGVGTIDQALLGVLGVKHGFVRLHGLAGKVVVVDEVHAYDTYTGELLARLLAWLKTLGAHVVLLSATLPSRAREALASSYGGPPPTSVPYPRISVVNGGRSWATSVPSRRPPVSVKLAWKQEAALVGELARVVADGGNVAVIVNTVARAQSLALRLRAAVDASVPVRVLHARFPFEVRQQREREAEALYGPSSTTRPRASILVGTQVLEQSLDLDFDLMVTDLAPVDLVLQRSGRLHRHAREGRPMSLAEPQLWVLSPNGIDRPEGPAFGVSTFVYDEAVLLRTWCVLRDRLAVSLPADIESLVETVYGDAGLPGEVAALTDRLGVLDRERAAERAEHANVARTAELPDPTEDGDPWNGLAELFEDEDPRINPRLRARTRLGEESVTVVPMRAEGAQIVLFADERISVDPSSRAPLDRARTVAIARQGLKIARRGVTHELLRQNPPPAFDANGHLRFHRPLLLDASGSTTIAGVSLRLDPDLGLIIGNLNDNDADQPT